VAPRLHRTLAAVLLAALVTLSAASVSAQPPGEASAGDAVATAVANAARTAVPAERSAPLVFANRFIVEFRATVLARSPANRAAAAHDLLGRLIERMPGARVGAQRYGAAILLTVGGQPLFVVYDADVDPLQGERLVPKADDAVARLQVALDETVELRTPSRLVRAAALALGLTLLYVGALSLVVWVDRRVASRLARSAERRLLRLPGGETLLRVADTGRNIQRLFALISFVAGAVLTYAWLTSVLTRFPYTRPWGESLRGALVSIGAAAAEKVSAAMPNVLIVLLIALVARFLVKLATLFFAGIEEGRFSPGWMHSDTAAPTRRIVVALLWAGALVTMYPYLPGSQSEAFKGVSVFVGLVISLGSTGVMNQILSGLMVTYSRALKVGDFVKVANIEGTVTELGTLATRVTTPRNEEITIPNSLVLSDATTNFSRNGDQGVFTSTGVTIGYDTPWRQVHALLQLAASRTEGIRTEPKPTVMQVALEDFYVNYRLFLVLEQPQRRLRVLAALHANIQDAFNEFGVQIMSPHYESDPSGQKLVSPDRWYSEPAAVEGGGATSRRPSILQSS
jgi:small-conductance mechanosensitive channel